MSILRDLILLNSTTLSGITINATKAGYLQGATTTAQANKCLIANSNSVVSLNDLNTTSISATLIAATTIDNNTLSITGGITNSTLTVQVPILNNSISGTALEQSITANSIKVASSSAVTNYLTNELSNAPNIGTRGDYINKHIYSIANIGIRIEYKNITLYDLAHTSLIKAPVVPFWIINTTNQATSTSGGLDTGTLIKKRWYYIYIAYDGTRFEILWSLSNAQPYDYNFAYTHFAPIGVFFNKIGNIVRQFEQINNEYYYTEPVEMVAGSGSVSAWTALSTFPGYTPISDIVPINIIETWSAFVASNSINIGLAGKKNNEGPGLGAGYGGDIKYRWIDSTTNYVFSAGLSNSGAAYWYYFPEISPYTDAYIWSPDATTYINLVVNGFTIMGN